MDTLCRQCFTHVNVNIKQDTCFFFWCCIREIQDLDSYNQSARVLEFSIYVYAILLILFAIFCAISCQKFRPIEKKRSKITIVNFPFFFFDYIFDARYRVANSLRFLHHALFELRVMLSSFKVFTFVKVLPLPSTFPVFQR